MATDFKISVDLSELLSVGPIARAGIFNNLSAAVERVTMAGAERWRESVMRAPLWIEERRAYAASIKYELNGPYSATITADYKYVEDIETGRPAWDMKRMLDTSMKVRVSKKGRRYLIIPMRHNTPGNSAHAQAMPDDVYAAARSLEASKVVGHGKRESGTGAFDVKTRKLFLVRQRKYQWGGRLPAGLAPKLKTTHKTDPYAGMVRFDTASGKSKSYSTYLTFRVMAEGQSGWIRPATPGLFIAKKVVDGLRPDAENIFSGAIKSDLSAA